MAYNLAHLYIVIRDHLLAAPHLTLEDLASYIGVERHTIEKAVRLTAEKSFRDLRNSIMIQKALALLQGCPNIGIKEIAFELKYGSHRAFSRFVRDMTGLSPKEIRQGAKLVYLNEPS